MNEQPRRRAGVVQELDELSERVRAAEVLRLVDDPGAGLESEQRHRASAAVAVAGVAPKADQPAGVGPIQELLDERGPVARQVAAEARDEAPPVAQRHAHEVGEHRQPVEPVEPGVAVQLVSAARVCAQALQGGGHCGQRPRLVLEHGIHQLT